MPLRLGTACALALLVSGVLLSGQPIERDRADALARRAAERLQALHDEADRLAADERSLLGDLRRLEVEREIRATESAQAAAAVVAATGDVAALDQQIETLAAQTTAAVPDLEARLVTLYKLGRGRYARLLLSATDLRQFGQAVRLVSALAEQDRQRVAQHRERLAALDRARANAQERRAALVRLQDEARRAQRTADVALNAHRALVRDIDARRDLNAQYSSELLAAQQRLEASVAGLAPAAAALPIAPFKGDLPWPAAGTLRHGFGSTESGRPPLRGVELATSAGADVQAVHDGTVAFADVFTGYGRLVIVDHGSQAFTMYGNLDETAVQKGMHVDRGQRLGSTGPGEPGAGALYFELRIDGRAVNPVQWLTKR